MSHLLETEITYRLVSKTEKAAQAFYRLSEESYKHGSPWIMEQFENTLSQPMIHCIVAEAKGELIGFLIFSVVENEAEIYHFVVAKIYQRKGIGMALIEEAKQAVREKKGQRIFLEVRASNEPALSLYKQMGFKPIGRRKGYYIRPVEDAMLLKCEVES